MHNALRPLFCTVSTLTLLLASPATGRVPDQLALGRDAAGEPCSMSRDWTGSQLIKSGGDQSHVVTCRSVIAARPVGRLFPPSLAAAVSINACGKPRDVVLSGIGPAVARFCADPELGADVVDLRVARPEGLYAARAIATAVGPVEQAMSVLVSDGANKAMAITATAPASFSLNDLDRGAQSSVGQKQSAAVPVDAALKYGRRLIVAGRNAEASRLLNDALGRLSSTANPRERIELLLEAALADSNIRFFGVAEKSFSEVANLISALPSSDGAVYLDVLRLYRNLDLLNRNRFAEIVAANKASAITDPNASTLQAGDAFALSSAESVIGVSQFDRERAFLAMVRRIESGRVMSVALLGTGNLSAARSELDAASAFLQRLRQESGEMAGTAWLAAKLLRQQAAIAAQSGDWSGALGAVSKAVDELQRSDLASTIGAEGLSAQLRLDRAIAVARSGTVNDQAIREFDAAVAERIAVKDADGGSALPGIEIYFQALLDRKGSNDPETDERYFKAMQAVTNPASARQLAELKLISTADPATAALYRTRSDVERTLRRLRYALASGAGDRTVQLNEQEKAEAELLRVNARLLEAGQNRQVEDSPVTVAELKSALRAGELFVKYVDVGSDVYAIAISQSDIQSFKLAVSREQLSELISRIRTSIDGQVLKSGQLSDFDVEAASRLFGIVSGPAKAAFLAASAIIVDSDATMSGLPLAVAVTSADGMRQVKLRKDELDDYSSVSFLGLRTEMSTAISPRSFVQTRQLAPSKAQQPFLGFAEPRGPAAKDASVAVGSLCPDVSQQVLARQFASLSPIPRTEIDVAARALGAKGATLITHEEFSDKAISANTGLGNYAVLHFATHGFAEGEWGGSACNKSPPGLLTTFADSDSDGLLSFEEISRLRLDANLVMLAACNTGAGLRDEQLARSAGQEETGVALEGLVRAFLSASQVRAVVASHWPTSAGDDAIVFFERFYTAGRSGTIGFALQQARQAVAAQPNYSHPFFWAPYFLVGDGSKPLISPLPQQGANGF